MLGQIIGSVRRNHALEHATISVLAGKLGRDVRLVGRATRNGFYLYGDMPVERVRESVIEALQRLRRGESHLAVSPMCGTNLAVAGLLAGFSSLLALGNRSRLERIPNVLLASMLAVLAAQPLGRLAQKHVTTDPDLSDTELVGIRQGGRGPGRFHKVETTRAPR
ncbi:MAG: hypothetical protein A2148_00250 [Chloroflexi bacterium RBG_16_68_14]|nr:MAG: hypothetical protein A2148_00250 [Chloroflexi bacterium RBG_16_68_14]